jgi:hypothetical protein
LDLEVAVVGTDVEDLNDGEMDDMDLEGIDLKRMIKACQKRYIKYIPPDQ